MRYGHPRVGGVTARAGRLAQEPCDHLPMGTPLAEVEIDADLVRALLLEQHPDLADLPLRPLASGWDNEMLRLGDELVVRLPRRLASAHLLEHEQRWLPALAPTLPLPVPAPLRKGRPTSRYPWSWSIVPWIPGRPVHDAPPARWDHIADQLGGFLAALHHPAPADAPINPYRGRPLAERTERLQVGLAAGDPRVDRAVVEDAWTVFLELPPSAEPPLWLHGDLHPLNVLVEGDAVSGIIDFGDMTAGDRATDLSLAWLVLPASARPTFRAAAGAVRPVDDDTWARARATALAFGVAYLVGDERIAAIGARAVHEALADAP